MPRQEGSGWLWAHRHVQCESSRNMLCNTALTLCNVSCRLNHSLGGWISGGMLFSHD